jgi:putative DNA methylase
MAAQMMGFVGLRSGGAKVYLSPDEASIEPPDEHALAARTQALEQATGITLPDEQLDGKASDQLPAYGMGLYRDLFTSRQLLSMLTIVKNVRRAYDEMILEGIEPERSRAIMTFLAIVVDKMALRNNTQCIWETSSAGGRMAQGFSRQAIQMVWDFAEAAPLSPASRNFLMAVHDTLKNVNALAEIENHRGFVTRGSAEELPYPEELIDAVITDPPYYDYIFYADLSDFFYVWLKRTVGFLYPSHFSTDVSPKKKEAVASPYRHPSKEIARAHYEQKMNRAFLEVYRVLKPQSPLVVV